MSESVRRLQAIRVVGHERYELAFGLDGGPSDLTTVWDARGRTVEGEAVFGTRPDLVWSGDADSVRSLVRLVEAFDAAREEGFVTDQ